MGRIVAPRTSFPPFRRSPSAQGCRVVVTSVRRLKGRVTKEVILQGLECPPAGWIPSRDPTRYEAVELFTAVASSISPNLDLGDDFQAEIAPICFKPTRRPFPLAIILAAARVTFRSIGLHTGISHLIERDSGFGLALGATLRDTDQKGGSVRDALGRTYLSLDSLEPCESGSARASSKGRSIWRAAGTRLRGWRGHRIRWAVGKSSLDLRVIQTRSSPPINLDTHSARCLKHSPGRELDRHAGTRGGDRSPASYYGEQFRRSSLRYATIASHSIEPSSVLASEAELYCALDHLLETGSRGQALELAADMGHLAVAGRVICSSCSRRLDALVARSAETGATTRTMAAALSGTQISAFCHVDRLGHLDAWPAAGGARGSGWPVRGNDHLVVLRGLSGAVLALPVTLDFASAAGAAGGRGRELAEQIGHTRWLARFTAWSGMVAHQIGDYESARRYAADALGMALRSGDRSALVLVRPAGFPGMTAPGACPDVERVAGA